MSILLSLNSQFYYLCVFKRISLINLIQNQNKNTPMLKIIELGEGWEVPALKLYSFMYTSITGYIYMWLLT